MSVDGDLLKNFLVSLYEPYLHAYNIALSALQEIDAWPLKQDALIERVLGMVGLHCQ